VNGSGGILVLGYGNPGRLDDGLGPALAGAVEALGIPGVEVDSGYQLMVEDAARIAGRAAVVFADAAAAGPEPFSFEPVEPAGRAGFTTHSVSPGELMALAAALFGSTARGYILGIRGYAFDAFGERLSPRARANLDAALAFLVPQLRAGRLPEAAPVSASGGASG